MDLTEAWVEEQGHNLGENIVINSIVIVIKAIVDALFPIATMAAGLLIPLSIISFYYAYTGAQKRRKSAEELRRKQMHESASRRRMKQLARRRLAEFGRLKQSGGSEAGR